MCLKHKLFVLYIAHFKTGVKFFGCNLQIFNIYLIFILKNELRKRHNTRNIFKNYILWSLKLISKFRIFTQMSEIGAGRFTVLCLLHKYRRSLK